MIETDHDSLCENFLHNRLRTRRQGGEFFALEPTELEQVIAETRAFIAEFVPKQQEAVRLAAEENDDRILDPDEALLNTYQQLLQVRDALDDLEIQRAQLETTLGSRSEQQPGSKGSRAGRPTPAIGSIPTGADSPSPSSTPDFCVSRESVPSASSQAATTTEGVV